MNPRVLGHSKRAQLGLSSLVVWVLYLVLVGAPSCAGTHRGPTDRRSALVDGMVTLMPHRSPAQWAYHPRTIDLQDAFVSRVNAQRLLLTRDGQRWLSIDGQPLVGAEQVAPEPLVSGSNARTTGWHFLGRSGTSYESLEPLGPFHRINIPPAPLARVAAASQYVMGVTEPGHLVRSTDGGSSWLDVATPNRVADVALLPNGSGLALLSPEGFLTTDDFGAHFTAQSLEPFGAFRLRAEETSIRVEGPLEARRWSSKRPAQWEADGRAVVSPLGKVGQPLPHASGQAMRERRAVLYEGSYVEVQSRQSQLTLLRGAVTEALQSTPLDDVAGCRSPRLEGSARLLYLVCGAVSGKVTRLDFWRSKDAGDSWAKEPFVAFGDAEDLRTAVWNEQLVISGICAPEQAPSGCSPSGVYVRGYSTPVDPIKPALGKEGEGTATSKPASKKLGFVPVAVPALRGTALDLSVSSLTNTLLVVGTRTKSDALVLFSSEDGGRTFRAEEIEELTQPSSSGSRRRRTSTWVEQTRWSQDGYAAITLSDPRTTTRSLLIVNEHGELVQLRDGPTASARVAGAGLRALAVEPQQGEAWESTDGGNRWLSIGKVPVPLCPRSQQDSCDPALICHEQGCQIGDSLSRIGWVGQDEAQTVELSTRPSIQPDIQLQTPFACRIADDTEWASAPGGELPDASRASLGYADWLTHVVDWDRASVQALEVALDGPGTLNSYVLFDAKSDPAQWVVYVTGQTEGVAALRAPARGAPVEVAWRDLNRGKETFRAKLPKEFALPSSATRFLARAGKPGLVSIAAGGLFVRFGADDMSSPTLLIGSPGGARQLPPSAWSKAAMSGRTEMIQVEQQPIALKLFRGGATLVGASLSSAQAWQTSVFAPGLADPDAFNVRQSYDLAYLNGQPQYHLWQIGPTSSQSWLFPFQTKGALLGEPTAAPTQRGLNGAPESCSIEQRTSTARVLAAPESMTIYPVVVSHSSEPFRSLVTRTAVLYGSSEQPCLAAFEAESVARNTGEEIRALVRSQPSEPSWLFRRISGSEKFEYRRMSCALDPTVEVPNEVHELVSSSASTKLQLIR